jgi:dephospho-CoA kinase
MVIGITGGIGAGKSTVMNYMKEHFDCFIIMADDVARDLQMKGEEAYKEIVDWLGEEALLPDLELNRAYIADYVFEDSERIDKLNSIVHPKVRERIVKLIDDNISKYKHIALEAALLVEQHYEDVYDELWYVHTPKDIRIKRLMSDRGYSYEKCLSIISKQLDDDSYKEAADYVIINDGDFNNLYTQLKSKLV